mmetsp:Transcript_22823/g.33996  ORF Transcript_22823/g.33996 Transcript_22823/m.33996 type:complete len:83 (-) Transcript_22823:52-300(-)
MVPREIRPLINSAFASSVVDSPSVVVLKRIVLEFVFVVADIHGEAANRIEEVEEEARVMDCMEKALQAVRPAMVDIIAAAAA